VQVHSHVGGRLGANQAVLAADANGRGGDDVVAGPTSLCESLHSEKLGDGASPSPPEAGGGGLADAFWGSGRLFCAIE
jgi:hypothetical protein